MPQTCKACYHADRAEIDAAILAGEPSRRIAARAGIGEASVRRHAEHIPRTLALAAQAAEETRADDLMERTRGLETDARRLLAKAEREGDFRAAIAAVRAALDVVELLHRVASERKAEAEAGPDTVLVTLDLGDGNRRQVFPRLPDGED